MIHFAINITNPWSKGKRDTIKFWNGSTPWKLKFWEFGIARSRTIIAVNFVLSHRQSHAGFELLLGLFGYDLMFAFYDSRHWDYENYRWEKTEDKDSLS
jgi:hypothetical protein